MNRIDILNLKEAKLLKLVNEKFDTNIDSIIDEDNLSEAWTIAQKLLQKGYRVDVQAYPEYKKIEGIQIESGSPTTIFARYGSTPNFKSVVEGICKLGLIIEEEA